MGSFKIIGSTKDLKTNTNILYAQIDIVDYLNFVGEDFDRFEIQRRRETHKGYSRMKTDIINGTQLPPITLAIDPDVADLYIPAIEKGNFKIVESKLHNTSDIFILDGLQRTYIIKDIINDVKKKENSDNPIVLKKGQKLLLEFWFEEDIKHLIYRLIVLNAGQKPMSLRHQVELLFVTLQKNLEKDINGLMIYKERDEKKRTRPRKFPFDRLVTSYYAFITSSQEVKKENIVAQNLNEKNIFDKDEAELSKNYSDYKEYLRTYCELDDEVFRIYSNFSNTSLRTPKNWLADENVINSFFAAIAQFGSVEKKISRINQSLRLLKDNLQKSNSNKDPFNLLIFSEIRQGFNPKKVNVGYATRKLLTNGFKEFFREEGEISFSECWKMSAE